MKVKFNIKLTKKQQEAYDIIHDKDVQMLIACYSRQCGKTVLSELLLIEYLFQPLFSAYISPTYAQGKKVYNEIIQLLGSKDIITKANASELRIETIYGGTLQFFSIQSPTSIRGNTISGLLVLDEAAFFPHQLPSGEDPWYNVILPITKARKPKILCISTPNGKQGFFYDLWLKSLNDPQIKSLKATIYDDELMTKEEIMHLKSGYPPLAWQQEFEVEFLDDALTVFPNYSLCFEKNVKPYGRKWIGIDPSSVGEDNTIVTVVDEYGNVEQHKVDGNLDEKYKAIASIINQTAPIAAYMENNSIGEVMLNEVKKYTHKLLYPFTTTHQTKKEYISLISIGIANKQLHFDDNNKLLYSELGTFTYKLSKTGNVTYAAKDGYHDDTVTSLGIALQCREDFKQSTAKNTIFVKTPNKSLL